MTKWTCIFVRFCLTRSTTANMGLRILYMMNTQPPSRDGTFARLPYNARRFHHLFSRGIFSFPFRRTVEHACIYILVANMFSIPRYTQDFYPIPTHSLEASLPCFI